MEITKQIKSSIFWLLVIVAFNHFNIDAEPVMMWVSGVLGSLAAVCFLLAFWLCKDVKGFTDIDYGKFMLQLPFNIVLTVTYLYFVYQLGWEDFVVISSIVSGTLYTILFFGLTLKYRGE